MNYTIQTIDAIKQSIHAALTRSSIDIPLDRILLERPRSADHGDYSCNIAMQIAKELKRPPRDIAGEIVSAIKDDQFLAKAEVAGPGFINLYLTASCRQAIIPEVLQSGERYGESDVGRDRSVQVEFVSANPTGPLHVGHGRGAAYGDSIASLLAATGHKVTREYYVNDAGRQMDILSISSWLRYLELFGHTFVFPEKGYQGAYVRDMAAALKEQHGDRFNLEIEQLKMRWPSVDEPELVIDQLIALGKDVLGEVYSVIHRSVLAEQLAGCREELENFGVNFDNWFSEQTLFDSKKIERVISELDAKGYLYTEAGARWFRSTQFGDEKDRVVQRENGIFTYFASDIAYHVDKFDRGFDTLINIWGADHHGYIPRVRAALAAMEVMDLNSDRLKVPLVQFAVLYRGKEKLAMSTRSGEFVTLAQLREDVGRDAARFFYVYRKNDQHLDFDLDLAKSQNNDNPVYYIQYAHARCASILAKSEIDAKTLVDVQLEGLISEEETLLMRAVADFPGTVASAASELAPHMIAFYLKDLSGIFHTYYNATQILKGDSELIHARLALVRSVKHVIRNGLALIGVDAPERM